MNLVGIKSSSLPDWLPRLSRARCWRRCCLFSKRATSARLRWVNVAVKSMSLRRSRVSARASEMLRAASLLSPGWCAPLRRLNLAI